MSERAAVPFSVSDLDDLTLLQRAIAAARFVSRESDVLLGSPRMAAIHTQVFDAIVHAVGHTDANRLDGWTAFRQLSNNPAHADAIIAYAGRSHQFHAWTGDEQLGFLRVCVAPFTASEDDLERLAERCRSESPR